MFCRHTTKEIDKQNADKVSMDFPLVFAYDSLHTIILFKKTCRTMKGCAKSFAMKCFVFL